MYHKPPEAFIGQGRYGADAVQKAAIEEQLQNARENPLAAAAAAAAVSGTQPPTQANVENLLDIDFDGAAPASSQKSPAVGLSGLEGLAGTPQRVASPAVDGSSAPPSATGGGNNLDDLMGLSNGMSMGQPNGSAHDAFQRDMLGGFADLDMGAGNQPPPAGQQLASEQGGGGKKTNEDLLGLF